MATTPVKPVDEDGDGHWLSQHIRFVCQSKEREPDVIFIGDSIIQQLQFTQSWHRYIEPLHALNFGIYGDATQNLLWRLQDGELDGINVKAVVLCIGSQNRGHSAEEIADGVEAVIGLIRRKVPHTSLIVLGLLPCGREPNEKRSRHKSVNQLLSERLRRRISISAPSDAPLNSGSVTFLQPDWDQLIQPNDSISHRDMYDYMHLTEQGFSKILDPLLEELQNSLQTFMKTGTSNETGAAPLLTETE